VPTSITQVHHIRQDPESVRTLDRLVESADAIDGLRASDVKPGDWVVVRTRNSVYSIAVLNKDRYRVTGGWFKNGPEGAEVGIAGCTWGGAAIHTRVIAATGMFLEFDNGVRTTRIREVTHVRGGDDRTAH
jgi:hypothetical protein